MKKRILVLISEGGSGPKIAGDLLREIFLENHEVEIVNVIKEIIHPIDFLSRLSSGVCTAEDVYNFLLRRGYHKGVNAFVSLGDKYMQAHQSKIERLFTKYLDKRGGVDLVISTIPFLNGGIAKALQSKEIPFLIVPTNLDTSTFFLGMNPASIKEADKILFAFPYDDADLRKKSLKNISFPKEKIIVTGFPVKSECHKAYTEEDIACFKKKHGMDPKKPSVTALLGTGGYKKLLLYAQALASCGGEVSMEINLCLGKNESLRKKLLRWFASQGAEVKQENPLYTSLEMPSGLVFHVRRFTSDFIEIMASSQLIITKTGSCSVNEAIYLGKKLLLDNTEPASAGHLFWEIFNLHFVRKHGLGDAFHDFSEMAILIQLLLQEDLGHPVKTGAFPLPNFKTNIQQAVGAWLS